MSKPNYHTRKWFLENLLATEMNQIRVKIDKLIDLGLSILEIIKTIMHEFWFDYIKRKYGNEANLCYMDTDSFIINIKTKDVYNDIANNIEQRYDTSNYEAERSLPIGKRKDD